MMEPDKENFVDRERKEPVWSSLSWIFTSNLIEKGKFLCLSLFTPSKWKLAFNSEFPAEWKRLITFVIHPFR